MAAQSDPSPITSLSVGLMVRHLLSNDTGVMSIARRIYPVVAESDAKLPYVCYRRADFDRTLDRVAGADVVAVECLCYAESYAQSIELAERVRACLDHKQATYTDSTRTLQARSIDLTGAEEGWADDAFAQNLIFTFRINNV